MSEHIEADLTPAERRRHRVRQTIIEAAERVFAEEGEDGLSIRRLADEIDYSPGAIYKYFSSKQELVDELKEGFFGKILERMKDVPDDRGPFLEYAQSCVETYIRTALERPHHYAAAFSGSTESSGRVTDHPDFSNTRLAFERFHDVFVQGVKKGVFRSDLDTYLAAKSIWASSHGLAQLMGHLPDMASGFFVGPSHDSDHLIRTHAELLIRGLTTNA
ncbi:MAG: TetR/AcrR family transcriptional regulator [Pseudomonadota bacterium]